MKLALILALLVFVPSVLASSENVDMFKDDSYLIEGHNITVLGFDTADDDKVLLCVDGQRTIISEGKSKIIMGLDVEVRRISTSLVKLNLESVQDNNDFNEHLNAKCYQEIAANLNLPVETTDNVEEEVVEDVYVVPSQDKEEVISITHKLINWILNLFR